MFWQIFATFGQPDHHSTSQPPSRHLEVVFKKMGGVEPAHPPEDAKEALGGGRLPVPGLPQHQGIEGEGEG